MGTNYGELLRASGHVRAARATLRRVLRQHAAIAAAAATAGRGVNHGGSVTSASQVWYNLVMVEADAVAAEAKGLYPESADDSDNGSDHMDEALLKEIAVLEDADVEAQGGLSLGSDDSASSRLGAALAAFLALEDPVSAGWQELGADTSDDISRRSALLLQRWASVSGIGVYSNGGVAATAFSSLGVGLGAAALGSGVHYRAPPWPSGQVEVARGLLLDALRGRGAYNEAVALFVHGNNHNGYTAPSEGVELPSCHALLCVGVATQQSGDLATAAQLYAAAVKSGEVALQRGTFPVASSAGGGGLHEAPLDTDARATLQNQVQVGKTPNRSKRTDITYCISMPTENSVAISKYSRSVSMPTEISAAMFKLTGMPCNRVSCSCAYLNSMYRCSQRLPTAP